MQLNTSSLNLFFPGLEDHYGPNLPIDIEYKLERLANFKVKEDDQTMSFDGDMAVKFWVNFPNKTKDLAVEFVAKKVLANFTLLVKNQNQILLNIAEAQIDDIVINSTTFGNVDLKLLTQLLDLSL